MDVALDVGALLFVAGADHAGGVVEVGDIFEAFVLGVLGEGALLLSLAKDGDCDAIERAAGFGGVFLHGDVGHALLGVDVAFA